MVANPSASQNQLWVWDGNSTLKAFDINSSCAPTPPTTTSGSSGVNTGGTFRVDRGAFDPADNIVMFANNADTAPFLTLVNASTSTTMKKVVFDGAGTPDACAGIGQSVWDPTSHLFFVAVPQIWQQCHGPGRHCRN